MQGVSRARERPGENGTAPAVQSTDMGAEPTREGGGGAQGPHAQEREREGGCKAHAREGERGGAWPTREKEQEGVQCPCERERVGS